MKKNKILFWIIIISISVYLIIHFNKYKIDNSTGNVKLFLTEFTNESAGESIDKVFYLSRIADSNTWLAQIQFESGDYGFVHFKQGWNQKLQFISLNKEPDVTYREYKTNKGKYGVVLGQNLNGEIAKIKITTVSNQEYFIDVSNETVFMKFKKLTNNKQDMFPTKFTFYDNDNNLLD